MAVMMSISRSAGLFSALAVVEPLLAVPATVFLVDLLALTLLAGFFCCASFACFAGFVRDSGAGDALTGVALANSVVGAALLGTTLAGGGGSLPLSTLADPGAIAAKALSPVLLSILGSVAAGAFWRIWALPPLAVTAGVGAVAWRGGAAWAISGGLDEVARLAGNVVPGSLGVLLVAYWKL